MTVASEISRLQDAKADIKAAIESKGVPVDSSVKIDGMGACIRNISWMSWWQEYAIKNGFVCHIWSNNNCCDGASNWDARAICYPSLNYHIWIATSSQWWHVAVVCHPNTWFQKTTWNSYIELYPAQNVCADTRNCITRWIMEWDKFRLFTWEYQYCWRDPYTYISPWYICTQDNKFYASCCYMCWNCSWCTRVQWSTCNNWNWYRYDYCTVCNRSCRFPTVNWHFAMVACW